MEHFERLERYSLTNPKNIVFAFINYVPAQFERIFSRMEFVTAVQYLSAVAEKRKIPVFYPVIARTGNDRIDLYLKEKLEARSKRLPPMSKYDDKFRIDFLKYCPPEKVTMPVESGDIFSSGRFLRTFQETGRNVVYLMGFQTEVEVHMSALGALSRNIFPVVISDATSTFSERSYFQALDSMSQVVEVIDTRDLIKTWGDW